MANKPKNKKKAVVKPLAEGEKIYLPCGGSIEVEAVRPGFQVVTLVVRDVPMSGHDGYLGVRYALRDLRIPVSGDTLKALPGLVQRALKSLKG